MVDLKPTISAITLNIKRLNTPMQKKLSQTRFFKIEPPTMCIYEKQETHFKCKDKQVERKIKEKDTLCKYQPKEV